MSEFKHIPIMLKEVLELLKPERGGIYADGTLGGGGSVTGDISVRNGFDVTVKPDGTTDTLVVDGAVALGPDAVLNVINPGNLQNGVFATFLSATSITGTFAGSNLEKPNGWSVSKTSAKVYRSAGTVLVFR